MPAFSQVRLKRRKANSKGSFSRTLTLGMNAPLNLSPEGGRAVHFTVKNQSIAKSGPVLGIETSCDETGVAVFDPGRGLLAHALYSQIRMHADYGGVVPELASRDHVRKLLPLIRQTLRAAGLSTREIGGVAYTAGPGLIGALLVGASCARALAWALDVPALGRHPLE